MNIKQIIREEIKRSGLGRDVKDLLGILKTLKEDAPKTGREIGQQAAASGLMNAALEGVLVGISCKEYVDEGAMTGSDAAKKVVIGAGSGFVTAGIGTAVTYGIARYVGGPMSIAAGMAASASSRYVYAQTLSRLGIQDFEAWLQEDAEGAVVPLEDDSEDDSEDDDDED